jgi:hypothetical protein
MLGQDTAFLITFTVQQAHPHKRGIPEPQRMEMFGANSSASGTHGAHEPELDRHLPCQVPALHLGERGMDLSLDPPKSTG